MPELIIHHRAAAFTRFGERMAERAVGQTLDLRLPGIAARGGGGDTVMPNAGRVTRARVLAEGTVLELAVEVPDEFAEFIAQIGGDVGGYSVSEWRPPEVER